MDALPSTLSLFIMFNSNDSSTPTILAMIGSVTVLKMSMFTSFDRMLEKELPKIVARNFCLPNNAIIDNAFKN